MRKLTIFIVCMLMTGGMFMPMTVMDDVEAQASVFFSEAALDGFISSSDNNYVDATYGPDYPGNIGFAQTSSPNIQVGQAESAGFYTIRKGYFSFNTSTIPVSERVVSAELNIRLFVGNLIEDFSVEIWNLSYGSSLTTADWPINGEYQTDLLNTTTASSGQWYSAGISPDAINKQGRTQFQLNSSRNGTAPAVGAIELVSLYSGNSASPPYLQITTVTESEAIITYNFSQTSPIPTDAMVEYWDEHITNRLETGFEDGVFGPAWTIFGSPTVTASYAPFEGIYHAGGSVSESGSGNHTFQAAINGTGLYNLTLSYYRKVQDVGGGTVSFIADWYNGSAWNELENLTISVLYGLSTWELNSTADNNPDLIFRFNVTLTAGSINNGAWIDNAELVTESGFHQHSNSTIYPSHTNPWNSTHEQIEYKVFVTETHPTIDSWILLNVDQNYTFQSHHPNTVNVTDEGGGVINITNQQHQDVYHSFWFLKPIDGGIGTNYSANIFPSELIDWQTQTLYRYEIWHSNWSYAHLQMPNASFVYQSINPFATVTQVNATTHNISGAQENTWLHIWFTVNKTALSNVHISLYRELTGIGIPWGTWDVYINNGTWTDEPNATQVTNPDILLLLGNTFTLTIYDWFPTPNIITNQTFIASNITVNVKVDVPIHPLNFKSFRSDLTAFRVFFNPAPGTNPYVDHIPAYEWYQFEARFGSYIIAIDFMTTTANGTATIDSTTWFNITMNGTYTIHIGIDRITIIYTTTNGINIRVGTITTAITPSVIIIQDDPALVPTHQVYPGDELPIFLDPWYVITADTRTSDNDNTTASATLNAGQLDTTLMAGSVIFMSDILKVSAANTTAIIMVNDTDTATNIINTTAPAGAEYDIVDDYYQNRGHALSVWVQEGAFSITREIRYRQSQRFNWEVRQGGHYFVCTVQINNTQAVRIMEPHVFVAFHNDTNPDLDRVEVFDQNNNIWLEKATGYGVDNTGVSFMFTNLSAGSQRSFMITYYSKNATLFGEGWIDPQEAPQWFNYNGRQMRYVFGTFTNNAQTVFEGVIKFSLDFSEASEMDRGSIIVTDLNTGDELGKHSHWRLTDSSIEIRSNYVGQIDPGGTLSIGVLYLRTDETTTNILTDPIVLGLSLPWLIFMIASLLLIVGLFVGQTKKFKEDGKTWINTGITLYILLLVLVILILAVAGS